MMSNPDIIDAMKKWYESHRQHICLPGGKVGMVTQAGNASQPEDTQLTYYDSILGITFSFDPFTYPFTLEGTIVSEEPM